MQTSITTWDWKLLLFFGLRWSYFGLGTASQWYLHKFAEDTKQEQWLVGQLGALPHKGSRTGPGNETRTTLCSSTKGITTPAPGQESQAGWETAAPRRIWGVSCPWANNVSLWQKEASSLNLLKGADLLPELVKYWELKQNVWRRISLSLWWTALIISTLPTALIRRTRTLSIPLLLFYPRATMGRKLDLLLQS